MNANDAIKVLISGRDKNLKLLKTHHYPDPRCNFSYLPCFHGAHFVSKAFKRNFKSNDTVDTQVIPVVALEFVALVSIEFFSSFIVKAIKVIIIVIIIEWLVY